MANDSEQWFLRSSYPVYLPPHEALTKSRAEFDAFLAKELKDGDDVDRVMSSGETFTMVHDSAVSELQKKVNKVNVDSTSAGSDTESRAEKPPVTDGTGNNVPNTDNKMFTDNGDGAYAATARIFVDLFFEMENLRFLHHTLQPAWRTDPLITLKIIFHSRSIHLGKSSRHPFYKACAWLAQNHPLTLMTNLQWLCRPIIAKKIQTENEHELVIIDAERDLDETAEFDVKHGVSHGYWKDLLNLLALAANNKFNCTSNPADVLNLEDNVVREAICAKRFRLRQVSKGRNLTGNSRHRRAIERHYQTVNDPDYKPSKETPKEAQKKMRDTRHQTVVKNFTNDPVYRALHLTVARLFAAQLQTDLAAMRNSNPRVRRTVSLCGKWAPSHGKFHDKHTFVTTSIAEIMYPQTSFVEEHIRSAEREMYLRHAREQYRKDISALRKHLEVVERHITAGTFENIKYDRVPSIAMNNYTAQFAAKDFERFEEYLVRVGEGKASISGATLLPSTLMVKAEKASRAQALDDEDIKKWAESHTAEDLIHLKIQHTEAKVIDGQWNTLVKRIKDSGTLSSSIAVCDVSGSMSSPTFRDGTTPMHSAIGLSLLIAEVAEPPFAGSFITFSAEPRVQTINLGATLPEKYRSMSNAEWGMSTNFVAVFEDILLPLAREHKLKPEEMVKRVFVFSDMQFDGAQKVHYGPEIPAWNSSYERISSLFKAEGYEMPELVFWNLAGGGSEDSTTPKPVMGSEDGTCLVSGYSQGMLKVFLDDGCFDEDEESEDEVLVTKEKDGETITAEPVKKKTTMDQMAVVRKAIGHKAYDMLKVMD